MLDIKFVRENPDRVRENLRKRGMEEKIQDIDRLLDADARWRQLLAEADALRRKRNEITQAIAEARKKKQDPSALMKQAEAIPDQIKQAEVKVEEYRQQAEEVLLNIPNIIHESVPF